MNSEEYFSQLNLSSPRYSEARRNIIERLSKKGSRSDTGRYSTLGPFYEIYMYAFFIGFHKDQRTELPDRKGEFLKFGEWKPDFIVKSIITMILVKYQDSFKWNDWELTIEEDEIRNSIKELVTIIEEYANAGLIYLEEKYNEDPHEFDDPFVFINLLISIIKK